jgi:excisionase family DNA binding protein
MEAVHSMAEKLMNVHQFAEALGITSAAVRRWLWERRVTAVKVGRCVRIPQSEVERIINAGLRPARPAEKSEKARSSR